MYTHWIDADHNGLDTRKELLQQGNLAHTGYRQGRWYDPYTGRFFSSADSLQIDHVVALSEAHRSGAWAWDSLKRMAYANDLQDSGHLLAVYGPVNEEKSDKDPAHWMPPNFSYWKEYARNWVRIKKHWGLTMDEKEYAALRKALGWAADSVDWPEIAPEVHCGGVAPSEHESAKHEKRVRESAFNKPGFSVETGTCCRHCRRGHSQPCGDACIGVDATCHDETGCACWAK